jgi:hypothetical protein
MKIDDSVSASTLLPDITKTFELAAEKCRAIDSSWDASKGTPVFTVDGQYTTRGWTEWTQGFVYGNCILAGDALGDQELIDLGRRRTVDHMLPHVTHVGVHDHGFNNLSTYGNLLRLMNEGRLPEDKWERKTYENAIAASGAVQASRWAGVPVREPSPWSANSKSLGYVTSFNGPHSLFIDTMRTIRILGVAWQLGHVLMHENDRAANLLKRSVLHGLTTSQYIVFHGPPEADRDLAGTPYPTSPYNVRGRTAHEGVFNRTDGNFRCRSTQQGYSPFSTWTRGLAWAVTGFAEELEFFSSIDDEKFADATGLNKADVVQVYEQNARDTADHFIYEVTTTDGITYWDDGAPGLAKLEGWREKEADPYNDYEPVDAGASAIAAQGLIRLGKYLGEDGEGAKYFRGGLTTARTLLSDAYLATDKNHQGILLHNVYHWPNGWDHVPGGQKVPCNESAMWGDYHLLELATLVKRLGEGGAYPTFYI